MQNCVDVFLQVYGDVCYNVAQMTKMFSQRMKVYKELLGNGKILFFVPVSTWNHMNVVVRVNANGNIFPNKAKSKNKLDVFVSQLDALVAFDKNRENLNYYYQ
ncbi:phage terminase family protein [Weissella cibaria]|uniref:phage terminase family protein n=1 Tax=Weissella cibaria TaxID=137591 RepID=UPI00223B08F0|nr:phage terminase family protein [Weissella cibaria]MCC6121142.1 phage terminase family protein [Weissella cibaria]